MVGKSSDSAGKGKLGGIGVGGEGKAAHKLFCVDLFASVMCYHN